MEEIFGAAQQIIFEWLVEPLMFSFGLASRLEDGYAATGWLLVGLLEIAALLLLIGPLQRWRPAEPAPDRAAIRTDVIYTLIRRLGLFRVLLFFSIVPWTDELFGALRVAGWGTWQLDQVWPGVTDLPWLSLVLYLVVFDFAHYWIHRAQHAFGWWWSLHALHHAQRHMTMWSDSRNHLLDDLIRDSALVILGQLIGVSPGQFVAVVALTQLSENLQHANVRLAFGGIGERLWVSPRFHRLHHAIGMGQQDCECGPAQARNFGVLLPWWDLLFGTARIAACYEPTGVRDQVEAGRNYGRGFWSQQWMGVLRLAGKA